MAADRRPARSRPGSGPGALLLLLLLSAGCSDGGEPGPRTVYGGDRPVTLRRPASLEPGRRYPLVLVLHGYGATGGLQLLYLQLTGLAEDPGAFVLAPDGTPDPAGRRFWNAGACCQVGGTPVDDVAYLGRLLEDVSADWPVDPARVVVIGHSNGHFMAYRLACERADAVTAIAGLAGAATAQPATCAPSRPVSVLHVHGSADAVIAYGGGVLPGGAYPGAEASAAQWAAHGGCGESLADAGRLDLEAGLAGDETTARAAVGCPAGVGVELWTIEGGGHVPSLTTGFGRRLFDWLAARPRP